jgi:hypothetical protein
VILLQVVLAMIKEVLLLPYTALSLCLEEEEES